MTDDSTQSRSMPDLLLVEDNPLHLRLIKSMLADVWPPEEVARLRHARTLEETIAAVAVDSPACVLLDLVLPDADGTAGIQAIRRQDPSVPIVVLSAHEDVEMARAAIDAGAQDYLVKGAVSPVDLERSVTFAMGRKGHERRVVAETPGVTPWPVNPPRSVSPPQSVQEPAPKPTGSGPLGTAVVGSDGRLLFMEQSIATAIGRSVQEATEKPIEELVHPNDVADWTKLVGGDKGPADIRFLHPSGHPIYLRVSAQHMAATGGESGAVVATFVAGGEPGTASSGAYVVMKDWG